MGTCTHKGQGTMCLKSVMMLVAWQPESSLFSKDRFEVGKLYPWSSQGLAVSLLTLN